MEEVEEKLVEMFGPTTFRALRWYISRMIGGDMIEALDRDPERVRKALLEFFKSEEAVKIIFRRLGLGGGRD
mgnify:CR=1 FL=1